MTKRKVHFKASGGCYIHPQMHFAIVFPVDHPDSTNVSNTKDVRTSKVLKVQYEQETVVEFETENTLYVIDKEQ
jgi:hypothetical protein